MSERELIEFGEGLVSFNIHLRDEEIAAFRRDFDRVAGIQQPLIETHKNGLLVFIPWVLKDGEPNKE